MALTELVEAVEQLPRIQVHLKLEVQVLQDRL
jgi:hypothetical protein